MIDKIEKVMWGLSVLVLAAIAACFLIVKPPTTTPRIEAGSVETSEDEFFSTLPQEDEARAQFAKNSMPAPGADGKPPQRPTGNRKPRQEFRKINRATLERVSTLNDALHEANFASSEVVNSKDGGNALKLTEIQEGSILSEIGIKEEDVIESINGQRIDFSSKIEARGLYEDCLAQLEAGQPIVVTLMRRGQPTQVVIGADWLRR